MKALLPHTLLLLVILATFACKKEQNEALLQAMTGPDTTASIGDTVWLYAAASTGNYTGVQWNLRNQPGDDSITNSGSDTAFLIPYYNGLYQVELTISQENLFSTDYQDILVSGAIKLEDQISESTRLRKIAIDDQADYFAAGKVEVLDQLLIDPEVVIEFYSGASLVIKDEGNIYAQNTSFIAADSSWQGIVVNSQRNTFTNCTIDRAGNASFTGDDAHKTAILSRGDATLSFSGNTISNSIGYGIIVLDDAEFILDQDNAVLPYRNNKFIDNMLGPMVVPVHTLSDLPGQFFEGDTVDKYIEIYESAYGIERSKNPQFVDMGLPYKVSGLLTFNKDLSVDKGVALYFESDGGIQVNGKLTVSGSEDNHVLLGPAEGGTGDWMGIFVNDGQADFSHTDISGAGNAVFGGLSHQASLTVEQLLSMRNSSIKDGKGIGLNMPGTAHIQFEENFSGNTISGHTGAAVRIRMDDVNKVVNGNTISAGSSTVTAIAVHAAGDDPLGSWPDLDNIFDYQFVESLVLKATKQLLIHAGASIRIDDGLTWTISGELQVGDSAGMAVSIQGTEAIKGASGRIFLNGTDRISLQNVNIQHGGGDFEDKANVIVEASAADVSIRNSSITQSKGYGVLIKAGASDFGINDAGANNTLDGDLGGFQQESK